MNVNTTAFTIAEYCEQMHDNKITVNTDYQRTNKVWPPAARSFLIDTVLAGFPMPKLILWQKLDVKTRTTYKEIVDGQQRSTALYQFYENKIRITGKHEYSGYYYKDLPSEAQRAFLEYGLNCDILLGSTEDDVRQVFRRMNSYTVPLNAQEKRHAGYQGEFKFFILDQSKTYADAMKDLGTFSERQLSRMADAQLLAEVVRALLHGIETASKPKLDALYKENDKVFSTATAVEHRLDHVFSTLHQWKVLHGTALLKPYNLYSLALAISHCTDPVPALNALFPIASGKEILDDDTVLVNLSALAEAAQARDDADELLAPFVRACAKATNTLNHRTVRFQWLCRALLYDQLV